MELLLTSRTARAIFIWLGYLFIRGSFKKNPPECYRTIRIHRILGVAFLVNGLLLPPSLLQYYEHHEYFSVSIAIIFISFMVLALIGSYLDYRNLKEYISIYGDNPKNYKNCPSPMTLDMWVVTIIFILYIMLG
jgi:hypothetical protein